MSSADLGCLSQLGDEVVVHRMEFRLQVVLVLGHFGGQGGHLDHRRPGRNAQHRKAQDCREQYGRDAAQPAPLEPIAQRAEQEAQQHGERQGDEQTLGQVKGRHDHGGRTQHPRGFDELVQGRHGYLPLGTEIQ